MCIEVYIVSLVQGYDLCCVGGTALGVSICETRYDDTFFMHYTCNGATVGDTVQLCDSCGMWSHVCLFLLTLHLKMEA